jgi:hypothetical protein
MFCRNGLLLRCNRAFAVRAPWFVSQTTLLILAHKDDSERVSRVLEKCLGKYGLELHPDKTRMFDFRFQPQSSHHHHAVALDRNGKRLYNKALPNDEAKLRALITELKAHGQLLFVVDQPATIGALPVAVARDEGVLVAYLPGLAMRRIADLHAGEAKTDARDAAIIAEAARAMPHTLRSL